MTPAPRIAALDVGRTLAVIGVIAVHLAPWMVTSPVWLDTLANLGQYGVQCFFVISAITIFASIEHDAQRLSRTREVLRNFYVKRFARIAPLYYLAIIGYAVVDYVARRAHGHMLSPHDFSDVILNLIFVHAWVPSATDSVVPGGWSISVEMLFYMIAPALVFFCRTRRGLSVVSILTALFSLSFWYFGACGGGPACRVVNNDFFYFWPPTQLPCFIVGFWTWHLAKDYLTGERVLPLRACRWLVLGGLVMVAALFLAGTGRGMAHGVAPTFAALATAALMLLLTRISSRTLQKPALVILGRNSFGIYIWHFVAILGVRAVVKIDAVDDFAEYHGVLVFAVSMAVATVVAYAGARLTARRVEEPCSRWARAWLVRVPLRVTAGRGAAADGAEGV
ncbi:Acyltransferase family protein [Caballeronia sp. SBC1]|uniref:acyltransferase family protein n=1 Tax=Caballeronia sp. SBC1 TaxID=2705548 RepID=UPI00140BB501|nr:acyltransferase [Caballeronia sp. SBC1]QIN62772.1 Acyltransferase family protein [Caballeronia sp. SBC1]